MVVVGGGGGDGVVVVVVVVRRVPRGVATAGGATGGREGGKGEGILLWVMAEAGRSYCPIIKANI